MHYCKLSALAFLCIVAPAFAQQLSAPVLTGNELITGQISGPGGTGIFIPVNQLRQSKAISIATYGASPTSTDNTTSLQTAINAAVANGVPLYIPSAGSACYKYTAPLTISGNLTILGDYVQGNWNGGINVPLGSPPLLGSVLCPTSNGSDAIDISGTSLSVNVSNIGILFQTPLSGTGDAFHYIPSGTNQGLSNAFWQNVMVYGHDGNHYAYNFQNPIYGAFVNLMSFGGGTLNVFGTNASANFGNLSFYQLTGQVIVGGTANGVTLTASASQRLNLMAFFRPQIIVNNVSGVSPGGNLPTSAQYIWYEDANVQNIRTISADLETNVSSSLLFGSSAHGNDNDWASLFTTAATLNAPSWTTNGLMFGPQTRTLNDTTSSGTVAIEAVAAIPGTTLTATSATTLTNAPTLYLGVPTAGTNMTITSPLSLYALGPIKTASAVTAQNGAFVSGTTQINTNNGTATTEIGDGTTTGQISIGGSSGNVVVGGAVKLTNISTDATHTDATVCEDTTSHQLYFGSGTAGICLGTSSARYKHDVASLDAGLAEIMALKPVQYKLNADRGDPTKLLYGFTAEQGQKAIPQLVGLDDKGKPNTFDYVGVVPVLVKAIQEQQRKIAKLERKARR